MFFVSTLEDLNVSEVLTTMETVSENADHKTELEEKVRSIEVKKASFLADISSLKRRITALEKCVNTLETALRALRTEKVVSEEKVLTYEVEAGYDLPPSTAEGLLVWLQLSPVPFSASSH